ncbi:MAG TPA: type VI secretion system tube protein TssD [Anaeromyxobacteraceae bacterium]|jgi:type VI secretion system secreted protein Hcp
MEPIWLQVEFGKGGKLESTDSAKRKGLEGWIEVFFYEHEVKSPRDAATGMASGKRQHGPVKFIKRVDSTSPGLWQALANNDTLKKAEFKFFKNNRQGELEHYFSVMLEDGGVSNIHSQFNQAEMAARDTAAASAGAKRGEAAFAAPALEEVSFTYRKITWEHKIAKKMAQDDWQETA